MKKVKHKTINPIRLKISSIMMIVMAACQSVDRAPVNSATVEASGTSVYTFEEVPVAYTSIPEISSKSDLVVIGQTTAMKEIINTARVPGNPEKPDPEYFSIGRVYEIQVDDYLKGSGAKVIYVPQHQGFLSTPSGPPTVEMIAEVQKAYDYIPLTLGKNYLMFLMDTYHIYEGYSEDELFIPVGHPWLFDLSEPDCVRFEDALEGLNEYFPPQPLASLLKEIDKPFTPTTPKFPGPYPASASEVKSLCPDEAGVSYPDPYP